MGSAGPRQRAVSIDRFRGLAILGMVLANFLAGVDGVPGWMKHPVDVGLHVPDIVAPMFVTAIGLTYGLSFARRAQAGRGAAYAHFARRYGLLLAIGVCITLAGVAAGLQNPAVPWGLFETLGAAGLVALLFIALSTRWRIAVSILLLVVWQFALDTWWLDRVRDAVHNGPWGVLAWSAMLLLATAFADLYWARRLKAAWAFALTSAATGAVLALVVPVSKARASVSYVLLALGISLVVFLGIDAAVKRYPRFLRWLDPWGANPFALYLAHGVILGVFALPPSPLWYHQAPVWLTVVQAAAFVAVLDLLARLLVRRGWYLRL